MTARDSLLPRAQEGAVYGTDAIEQSLATSRMTIVLARDGEEKARLLATLPQWPAPPAAAPSGERVAERRELLAALRAPYAARSNGHHGSPTRTPLVLRAQDLGASPDAVAALADRLTAANAGANAILHGLEALESGATSLLADDGGPIAQLTARLRHVDDALDSLRADEAVEQAQIEALLTAGTAAPEIERERDRLLAERDHWQALTRLWPDWQGLQAARQEFKALAKFERLPGDLDARVDAVNEHCQRAEGAVRAARRRLSELEGARQAKRGRRERGLEQHVTEALRLHDALPVYRSQLLEIGATRARLAELERTLGTRVEGLGGETEVARLIEQLTRERRIAPRRWRERAQLARAARTAAEQRLSNTRERLRTLSAEASEELAKEGSAGDADVDVRWRSLWHLRAHLEEIWEVQSRAEAKARTLRDREDTLRGLEEARYWRPGRWLRLTLNGVTVGVAAGAFWAGVLLGPAYGLPLGALTVVLSLLAFVLYARTRWVGVLEQRRSVSLQQLRTEIDQLRRGCDDDWRRAARLTELMRLASQRLSLPESVTLEMVEATEQELAADLREHGADTDLTRLLLGLLDAQDEEPRCAAILAEVEAEQAGLDREWTAWRAEAGLPPDLDVERADEWGRHLSELAAASAARATARDELAAIEPMIGAWERDARRLLERAGTQVSAELCGSALAAELGALVTRVRAEEEERRRQTRLETELHEAEHGLRDTEAELERARAARQAVIHASRAGDEAGLHAQLDGLRRWREVRERIAGLERAVETGLQGLASPADVRAQLARGEIELWCATQRDIETQLEQQRAALERIGERRRNAERRVAAAAEATGAGDLLQEREEVLAELRECAREWQLRVLAASLVTAALEEQHGVEKSELLQHASRHLASLSAGRFTAIARAEQPAALALVDRGGRRVALDAQLGQATLTQIHLSLLLGRAAQLAGRGAVIPIVIDDALATLPVDDAHRAAQEIARMASTHPVLYFTIPANRARVLSAMPSDSTVVDAGTRGQ